MIQAIVLSFVTLASNSEGFDTSDPSSPKLLTLDNLSTFESVSRSRKEIEILAKNHIKKINGRKNNNYSYGDLKSLIEGLEPSQPKQSLDFTQKAEKFRTSDVTQACNEFNRKYRDEMRLNFNGLYSNRDLKSSAEFFEKSTILVNYLSEKDSFKNDISSILTLVHANDMLFINISNDIIGIHLKVADGASLANHIYINTKQEDVLGVFIPNGELFRYAVRPAEIKQDFKRLSLQSVEINDSFALHFYLAKAILLKANPLDAEHTVVLTPPSEVKANLSKYLLKPGSYYDTLITDYANIPEPKPEKKP